MSLALPCDSFCVCIMAAGNGSGVFGENGKNGPNGKYAGIADVIRSDVGATTAAGSWLKDSGSGGR